MRAAWLIALKDLRLLLRDPAVVFLTLVLPVLYGAFFGVIFDGIGRTLQRVRLHIALVNEDDHPATDELIRALLNAGELKVETMPLGAASVAVRKGDISAYIRVPAGFGGGPGAEAEQRPAIEIGVSPRRRAEAGMLRALLMRVLLERPELVDPRIAALLRQAGLLGVTADSGSGTLAPIAVTTVGELRPRPENAFEISVPQGLIWGVLSCAAAFGMAVAREREQGTLMRLRTAPIRADHVILGKALACLLAVLTIGAGMLLLALVVFQLRPSAPWMLAATIPVMAIGFTGVMILLAAGPASAQAAAGLAWTVLTALGMLGGALVPTFLMPEWLAMAARISPVYWALDAFAGAMWREYSPLDMLRPLGVLLGFGIAGISGGWIVLARRH